VPGAAAGDTAAATGRTSLTGSPATAASTSETDTGIAMPGAGETGAFSAAAASAAAAASPAGPSATARTAATPRPTGSASGTRAWPRRTRAIPSVFGYADGRIVVSSPLSAHSGT
jgi:hypothetical protein